MAQRRPYAAFWSLSRSFHNSTEEGGKRKKRLKCALGGGDVLGLAVPSFLRLLLPGSARMKKVRRRGKGGRRKRRKKSSPLGRGQ